MDIVKPAPGKYVIAVSGGVDSVALLHLLQNQPGLRLTVAHFDHGIREDSSQDRIFVQDLARSYGLPFVYDQAQLGAGASEATARTARYTFLRSVVRASGAAAIITAHHQDDALETAIINIIRGTGRKGLSSLQSTAEIHRPLLQVSKQALHDYATSHELTWREDSTNQDDSYLRNHIRHQVLPKFPSAAKLKLTDIIVDMESRNSDIDTGLERVLQYVASDGQLERTSFVLLPHTVAREVMAAWLRDQAVTNYDRQLLERLVVAAKTAQPGQSFSVKGNMLMTVGRDSLALALAER